MFVFQRFYRFTTAFIVLFATLPAWAETLAIHTDDGQRYDFEVEVASTPQEKARGLMFRKSLPPFTGMVFQHDGTPGFGFWMKNTLIPLDMLFIDRQGIIRHIHPNAQPMSETSISWPGRTWIAVEIPGGSTEELEIEVGDTATLLEEEMQP